MTDVSYKELKALHEATEAELKESNARLAEVWSVVEGLQPQMVESLPASQVMGSTQWRPLGISEDPTTIDASVVRDVSRRARFAKLLSPIILAGVNVLELFTFAQGYNIRVADENLNDYLQAFISDRRNQMELFGSRAIMEAQGSLQTNGNLFLWFHPLKDSVQVRVIDSLEIVDIVCNPNDKTDCWFYLRSTTKGTIAYPSIFFNPVDSQSNGMTVTKNGQVTRQMAEKLLGKSATVAKDVRWETPIYHTKVNPVGKWGICSYLAALSWAKAYEQFLEHRLTLYSAYAIFAIIIKEQAKRLPKVRAELNKVGGGQSPVKGSIATTSLDGSLESLKTKDATTPPSEGVQFLEMVMMTFGFPPHLFGKEEPGGLGEKGRNKSFILRITAEQEGWADDLTAISEYDLLEGVRSGTLKEFGTIERRGNTEFVVWKEGVDSTITVTYPPLVEDDVSSRLKDIVSVTTLDGKAPAGHITPVQFMRLIQRFLRFDDDVVQAIADRLGDSWPTDDGAFAEFMESLKKVSVNGHG